MTSPMERSFGEHDRLEASVVHVTARASRGKRTIAWAQTVAFFLGASLLVYIIRKVGVQPIFTALARVGFGFFLVVALNGLRHMLRTIAMRTSVPVEHRRFTFMQAFAARLGGESMSFLTFAGPLLGEPTLCLLQLDEGIGSGRGERRGELHRRHGTAFCPRTA